MDVPAPSLVDPTARLRAWALNAWTFTQTDQFGNAVIVLFFLTQALDGALTYVGVSMMGHDIEGNPLLRWLMVATGQGAALALAKFSAAGFGIVLHLHSVHRAVALLTLLYVTAAVVPWVAVLTLAIQRGL
jgi:uncharacterized membrane protein